MIRWNPFATSDRSAPLTPRFRSALIRRLRQWFRSWPHRKFQNRIWLHTALLVGTIGSTWLVAGWLYAATIIAHSRRARTRPLLRVPLL